MRKMWLVVCLFAVSSLCARAISAEEWRVFFSEQIQNPSSNKPKILEDIQHALLHYERARKEFLRNPSQRYMVVDEDFYTESQVVEVCATLASMVDSLEREIREKK